MSFSDSRSHNFRFHNPEIELEKNVLLLGKFPYFQPYILAQCFLFQHILRGIIWEHPSKTSHILLCTPGKIFFLYFIVSASFSDFLLWKFFSYFLSFIIRSLELFTEIWVFPYQKKFLKKEATLLVCTKGE